MNYDLIQKNLITLLELNDMTQAELSNRLDVSKRQVNRWIKGVNGAPTKIPKTKLAVIADLFCIPVDTLTGKDIARELENGERYKEMFDRSLDYTHALAAFYLMLGVDVELIDEDFTVGMSKFHGTTKVKLSWKTAKGIEKTKIVSYKRWVAFARRIKEHALIELKYLK